ncbi:MAG: hypothetical protein PHS20_09420, partial [Sphaerochaetaceae bacterium]|nr:hypothetical protein [Sphaerochaetaceae bacterium]
IDDRSRLVCFAAWYKAETAACYMDCLWSAFRLRGLPHKVYYDYPEEKTMTKGIGLCLQAMELPDDCSA